MKHYIGYTSDLKQRMISHNELGNDWTKSYRPWRIIYTKAFDAKNDAIKYEKWLKSGAGRTFIKSMEH